MRWPLLQQQRNRLADERGTVRKAPPTRSAPRYPSPYHVAMSSLGFQTIYREINLHEGCAAERATLPEDVALWRESRTPLCTLESERPPSDFACIAFSISYELELAGLFEMLDLSGIPLRASERGDSG